MIHEDVTEIGVIRATTLYSMLCNDFFLEVNCS